MLFPALPDAVLSGGGQTCELSGIKSEGLHLKEQFLTEKHKSKERIKKPPSQVGEHGLTSSPFYSIYNLNLSVYSKFFSPISPRSNTLCSSLTIHASPKVVIGCPPTELPFKRGLGPQRAQRGSVEGRHNQAGTTSVISVIFSRVYPELKIFWAQILPAIVNAFLGSVSDSFGRGQRNVLRILKRHNLLATAEFNK